jgi:hypothetical protein
VLIEDRAHSGRHACFGRQGCMRFAGESLTGPGHG